MSKISTVDWTYYVQCYGVAISLQIGEVVQHNKFYFTRRKKQNNSKDNTTLKEKVKNTTHSTDSYKNKTTKKNKTPDVRKWHDNS